MANYEDIQIVRIPPTLDVSKAGAARRLERFGPVGPRRRPGGRRNPPGPVVHRRTESRCCLRGLLCRFKVLVVSAGRDHHGPASTWASRGRRFRRAGSAPDAEEAPGPSRTGDLRLGCHAAFGRRKRLARRHPLSTRRPRWDPSCAAWSAPTFGGDTILRQTLAMVLTGTCPIQ